MFNQKLEKMETMTQAQETKVEGNVTATETTKQPKDKTTKGNTNKVQPKADKKADKPAKTTKPTLAGIVDTLIAKGGKWEDLIAEGNAASKKLGMKTKFTAGTFKTQIHWRINVQGRKSYLTDMGMAVTENGIEKATPKKGKK